MRLARLDDPERLQRVDGLQIGLEHAVVTLFPLVIGFENRLHRGHGRHGLGNGLEGADADRGHDGGTQAPDVVIAETVERHAEAIGADLAPKIGARATAAIEQPVRSVAGGLRQRIEEMPCRERDALHDGQREFRSAGAAVEPDEGAADIRVPKRRPFAFKMRQEKNRPPIAIRLAGEFGNIARLDPNRVAPPAQ